MRTNVCYISSHPRRQQAEPIFHDKSSRKRSFGDSVCGRSYKSVRSDSGNNSELKETESHLLCDSPGGGIRFDCAEDEKDSNTLNPKRVYSIFQGVLEILKKSGSTFTKRYSAIFSSNSEKDLEKMKVLPVEGDADCNKENIPPEDMQSATAELENFRKRINKNEKRNLLGDGRRFELKSLVSNCNKHGREEVLPKNTHKRFRLYSKHTLDVSQFSPSDQDSSKKNSPKSKSAVLRRSMKGAKVGGDSFATQSNMQWFLELAEDPVVSNFLEADVCHRYADNYLLAMVFAYFVRSRFTKEEYNKNNFFAALYLAHDMEEDEEELKYEVFPWALGKRWRSRYFTILDIRDDIFWKIDCRAVVSKKCCDQVMEMVPDHWLWSRVRPNYHGGARRSHMKHPDENGFPRGPFRSPLQCLKCLECKCSESSNSYLLYISEGESSSDEQHLEDKERKEHKDSGYGTFLCDPSGNLSNATSQADAERSSNDGNSLVNDNDVASSSKAQHQVEFKDESNFASSSMVQHQPQLDRSMTVSVTCLLNEPTRLSVCDLLDDTDTSENELLGISTKGELPTSQADTVPFHPGYSQEF